MKLSIIRRQMMSPLIVLLLSLTTIPILADVGSTQDSLESIDNKRAYKTTQLSEIVEWQELKGGQYIIGRGRDPLSGELKIFAIYDKTFIRPTFVRFWQNAVLGTIGINDLNMASAIQGVETLSRRERQKKLGEYVYTLLYSQDPHKDQVGVYHRDFWRNENLTWKPGKKPLAIQGAPKVIPLSDFDFSAASLESSSKHSSIQNVFTKFTHEINDGSEDEKDAKAVYIELINNSEFRQMSDGNYELFQKNYSKIPPVKVIDIQGKYSSLKKAAAWAILTNMVKGGFNSIPLFWAPQACAAVFERFFNLVEVVYLLRHAMVLNLIMEAQDGNTSSPFYGVLNDQEIRDAISYLQRSNTLLSSLMVNIFANKDKNVEKYINFVKTQKAKSLDYLSRHNITTYLMENSYYALGVKRDEVGEINLLKVYSLIKRKVFRREPHAVVNFLDPNVERVKRNILESILIGSNFIPIPGITILKIIYKEIFVREVHRRIMAEAGFKGHLNHNPNDLIRPLMREGFSYDQALKYVDLALSIIENRSLNSLDLRHGFEEEQNKRRVENWLRDKVYFDFREGVESI